MTFFESQNHKIKVFEYIYFFSNNDPETWYELKKLNKTVFICPLFFSGGFSKDFIVKKISYALKFFRACIQRRWPPIDSSFFFKSANHYFVFKNQFSYVNKVWKIPENKITLISEDANEAAKLTHQTIGEAIC
ncbi:MAG: hypothetical protein HY072_04600 [Deltaproteobacteria bacterium]|nr:hypothetical protein [Deltaproteobacteria bacterium]